MDCTPVNPCLNGGLCDPALRSCVCTGGLVYQTSGPPPPTCQDPTSPEGTYEGCVCPPGLLLNASGVCVLPLQCLGGFNCECTHAVMPFVCHQYNHTVSEFAKLKKHLFFFDPPPPPTHTLCLSPNLPSPLPPLSYTPFCSLILPFTVCPLPW